MCRRVVLLFALALIFAPIPSVAEQAERLRAFTPSEVARELPLASLQHPSGPTSEAELQDLAAQRAMVAEAEKQTILTVVALILLAATLWYTKRAADAGRTAATAAHATVIEARKTTKAALDANEQNAAHAARQLKAYVFVSSRRLEDLPTRQPVVVLTWKNYGQTPAYDCVMHKETVVWDFPIRPERPLPPVRTDGQRSRETIGPGDERRVRNPFQQRITDEDWRGLTDGSKAIYVYGRITFNDTFGKQQLSNFCFFSGGSLGMSDEMAAAPHDNSATQN